MQLIIRVYKKQIAETVDVTNTTYVFEKLKERYGI